MKHYMDASKINVMKYYMHASIISKKKANNHYRHALIHWQAIYILILLQHAGHPRHAWLHWQTTYILIQVEHAGHHRFFSQQGYIWTIYEFKAK